MATLDDIELQMKRSLHAYRRLATALETIADKETVVNVTVQGGNTAPVETQYPELPSGAVRPGDVEFERNGWTAGNLVLPTWSGANPALVRFNQDGSATITAENINGSWNKGLYQIFRPAPAVGRWDATFAVPKGNSVVAFFTYDENTHTEFDFELVKRPDGTLAWQLNTHQFTADGQRRNPTRMIFVPVTAEEIAEVHTYSIIHDATATVFLIDGVEVGRFTPADLPADAVWHVDAGMDTFVGSYQHAQHWAGWTSIDYAQGSRIELYGIGVPGLRVPQTGRTRR